MFLPVVDEKECTNCRACERICPKNVFDSDEETLCVANACYCTGCESCSAVCPKNALRVEEV